MATKTGVRKEMKTNALWGKGGRGAAALIVVVALALPLAASAGRGAPDSDLPSGYIAPSLLRSAKKAPEAEVRVIVQSTQGLAKADKAARKVGRVSRRLGLVGAVVAHVPASRLKGLGQVPGVTITPDSVVRPTDRDDDRGRDRDDDRFSSKELWPEETGLEKLWSGPATPTIAIVDSGIQSGRKDFGDRIVARVNLTTLQPNSPGDGRGHGTLVAGLAAGSGHGIAGAAPRSRIVAIDVMDDSGRALTSDVIRAAEWILRYRSTYGIRVVNFSLHAGRESNFTRDPLNRAVEKLWTNGVVVVAASGNTGANGVKSAPGNDPFVITVGSTDTKGTRGTADDIVPEWSGFGRTHDGFAKPDLVAPGRSIAGPVPATSTLAVERALKMVSPGFIKLSGTSLSAPIVAGAAAQILGRHPNWSPDQVKGALMLTAKPVPSAGPLQVGVGQIDAARAASLTRAPNPNRALREFVDIDPAGGVLFDAASWESAARSDVSWDSVTWADASWADATWSDASWADVTWADVTWADVTWADVTWADVTWSDVFSDD